MADVNDSANISRKLQAARSRLRAADISAEDYRAIVDFANYRQGRVSRNTLRQDIGNLKNAAEAAPKPLVECDRTADVDAITTELEKQGVEKNSSKNSYVRAMRKLWEWLSSQPDYPEYEWAEDIEYYEKDNNRRIKSEEYLTESEITELVEAADHPREEAMVEFLADTGARINLVCNLRRKDIDLEHNPPTFQPNPNAKDGYKGVTIKRYPIHYSERHLRRWLNQRHPDDHPDAPLFPVKRNYEKSNRSQNALHVRGAWDALNKLANQTDVDPDRVSPHAFRHAAVRRMRMDPNFEFSWEIVKQRTAWSDRAFNEMKELYGALAEAEQLEEFARHAGREVADEKDAAESLFAECRTCGEENRRDARFCDRCGRALDEDTRAERRQVDEKIGAEKALASDGLTEADLEAIAENDELKMRLIEKLSED